MIRRISFRKPVITQLMTRRAVTARAMLNTAKTTILREKRYLNAIKILSTASPYYMPSLMARTGSTDAALYEGYALDIKLMKTPSNAIADTLE